MLVGALLLAFGIVMSTFDTWELAEYSDESKRTVKEGDRLVEPAFLRDFREEVVSNGVCS